VAGGVSNRLFGRMASADPLLLFEERALIVGFGD
jgi:hypothetical protein